MQLYNLEFTEEEIRAAAAADRLLSMEIEFSRECNFRCAYCYLEDRTAAAGEMSRQEIREVILQARELGARKIIILGGEPSIYPHLIEMLRFLGELGLEIEMFTNGSGVTGELAAVLAEERVRVVVKMNSRDAAIQDRLAGRKGAFEIIGQALERLRRAGYPSENLFLAASTVICRQNLAELPGLWQWLRSQRIEPYFEILTPRPMPWKTPGSMSTRRNCAICSPGSPPWIGNGSAGSGSRSRRWSATGACGTRFPAWSPPTVMSCPASV
jgi:MoaA/NifB/PqqE/SkfB family radical SAM enzyme